MCCGCVVQGVVHMHTWISHALVDDHYSNVELLCYTDQMLHMKNCDFMKSIL